MSFSGSDNDGGEGDDFEGAGRDAETEVDNEYYSFFNLPRTASEAEVTAAYKRLTKVYHPDKHVDEGKKKRAEMMFNKLKKAYEVLSDPKKRAIYDCLGKKGLEEEGWELIQRTKTPGEIREEYERIARDRADRLLQQRTNPTSRFKVGVNATDLFERYLYEEEVDDVIEASLPTLEISEIEFGQTIECPLTLADNVVLSGNVSTSNGTGDGSVGVAWRRNASEKSWYELNVGVGSTRGHLGGKFFRRFSQRTFVNMSGTLQLTPKGLKPGFDISFGNQLAKNTVGYLSYSTNWRLDETDDAIILGQEAHGMSTMVVHTPGPYHIVGSFQLGVPYTYMMLSVTRKFDDTKSKLRGALKIRGMARLGTFGAILEYGVEKRVTTHSSLSATMVVGVPVGITLRIKLTRARQTYIFPFHLSEEILPQPLFYGTVTPLLVWFTFKKMVLDPFEARKKRREREELVAQTREKVAESRREAEASIDLMRERYSRILAEEENKNGLVVVCALYGKIVSDTSETLVDLDELLNKYAHTPTAAEVPSNASTPTGFGEASQRSLRENLALKYPEVIDVTVPVQCLVEDNSRLIIYEGGNKSDLAGFYDPAPLEEVKQLLVRYNYQGRLHEVMVNDSEGLKLPRTAHRKSNSSLPNSSSSNSVNNSF